MSEPEIACSLGAERQRERADATRARIFARADQTEEMPEGYGFRFPVSAGLLSTITDFILQERECCPFFGFELAFEPGRGSMWLRLRGPDGSKQFVQQWAAQSSGTPKGAEQ
jgi:hypothetical protein